MKSDKVFVFPSANRAIPYDMSAKIMSEYNITNIIKSITDNGSFVINDDLKSLEFVLNGYYFKLSEELEGTKYASIVMDDVNDHTIKGDVEDGDVSDFGGLVISDNEPTGSYLMLCKNGVVPDESKIKFKASSLSLTGAIIDCGAY